MTETGHDDDDAWWFRGGAALGVWLRTKKEAVSVDDFVDVLPEWGVELDDDAARAAFPHHNSIDDVAPEDWLYAGALRWRAFQSARASFVRASGDLGEVHLDERLPEFWMRVFIWMIDLFEQADLCSVAQNRLPLTNPWMREVIAAYHTSLDEPWGLVFSSHPNPDQFARTKRAMKYFSRAKGYYTYPPDKILFGAYIVIRDMLDEPRPLPLAAAFKWLQADPFEPG